MTSSPKTAASLVVGTFVGEYQITGLLGEGGMGIVYAGIHPEIGKRVAIKVLGPFAAAHPDLTRRFKEEARAVNRIRHPNIIDIFAFNQLADGRHYFVMEYLQGESFGTRLSRGPIPPRVLHRLLEQICSALQAAHREGVVHRDLKPDNIWVATEGSADERIKLLDFGIAKLLDRSEVFATQSGVPLGTPHYMPPEQAMGRPVDARADIYALGVILYEVFTGRLPFEGATAYEIAMKHQLESPPPPARHVAISPDMEEVILACLEKEPGRRPQSVEELWKQINQALAGGALGSSVPSSATRRQSSGAPSQRTERFPDSYPPRTEVMPEPAPPTVSRTIELPPRSRRTGPSPDLESSGQAAVANDGARRWPVSLLLIVGAAVVAVVVVVVARRGHPDADAHIAPAVPSVAQQEIPAEPVRVPVTPTPAVPVPASPPEPAEVVRNSDRVRKVRNVHKADKTASKIPNPNCDPNFTLDAQGEKHFKPECFR